MVFWTVGTQSQREWTWEGMVEADAPAGGKILAGAGLLPAWHPVPYLGSSQNSFPVIFPCLPIIKPLATR